MISLEDFNNIYTKEHQGYRNNYTNKIVFCPRDLGFKFTQEDCREVNSCEECWNEAIECMKYRSENK